MVRVITPLGESVSLYFFAIRFWFVLWCSRAAGAVSPVPFGVDRSMQRSLGFIDCFCGFCFSSRNYYSLLLACALIDYCWVAAVLFLIFVNMLLLLCQVLFG